MGKHLNCQLLKTESKVCTKATRKIKRLSLCVFHHKIPLSCKQPNIK